MSPSGSPIPSRLRAASFEIEDAAFRVADADEVDGAVRERQEALANVVVAPPHTCSARSGALECDRLLDC